MIVEPAKRAIASTDYGCRPLRGLGLHSDMFLGFRFASPQALRCHALRALDLEDQNIPEIMVKPGVEREVGTALTRK
jgi:hypothetical protein